VITDNGYIFTAFTDAAGGNIYSYASGALVGTYGGGTLTGNEPGRTSLGYDAELDHVLAYFNVNGAEGAFIYDATQLSAIPEPSTYAAFAGVGALALAAGAAGAQETVHRIKPRAHGRPGRLPAHHAVSVMELVATFTSRRRRSTRR